MSKFPFRWMDGCDMFNVGRAIQWAFADGQLDFRI